MGKHLGWFSYVHGGLLMLLPALPDSIVFGMIRCRLSIVKYRAMSRLDQVEGCENADA